MHFYICLFNISRLYVRERFFLFCSPHLRARVAVCRRRCARRLSSTAIFLPPFATAAAATIVNVRARLH